MIFHYIQNLVSASAAALPCQPWEARVTRPVFKDKEGFRAWCKEASTSHAFISLAEGLTPSLRIDRNNPALLLRGMIVDYDSKMGTPMEETVALVAKRVPLQAYSPQWACSTYSGGARLIYLFEKPLLVETEELAERVLSELATRLGMPRLLPGLDKTTFELNRYFEIGTEWTAVPGAAPTIPEDFVMTCVFEAAKKIRLVSADTLVPVDVVAAEVEKRFPGRWPGVFEIGARGPLFWLPDGIDRVAGQITEHGMVCYSDRAPKSFMEWRDIFGPEFVREFTEKKIGDLTKKVWWDGRRYWIKGTSGRWFSHIKEDFKLFCKGAGFSDKLVKGRMVTEIEEVLLHVHEHRRITAAVPFVFVKQERVTYNHETYLNTNTRFAMSALPHASEGAVEKWPWLNAYFHALFDEPKSTASALDSFMAWLQRAYCGAESHQPQSGHVVIIAGDPGRGKTLLSQFILGGIFSGFFDASEFLLKGGFNKGLAEVGLWCVDDGTTAANFNDHRKFTEMLKRHVANPNVTYHPKFCDATMMPWRGRIVITCNLDADSLSVLPNLDTNILDKLMLFKLTPPDDEIRSLFNDYDVEATILRELPHFLTWLANWNPPESVTQNGDSRYGVNPFHHPDLIESARDASPDHRFMEIIDLFVESLNTVERDTSYWEGTATALLGRMSQIDHMRDIVRSYNPRSTGRVLSKLADLHPTRIGQRLLKGNSLYRIELDPSRIAADAEDPVLHVP
jgi:hypothetical protein